MSILIKNMEMPKSCDECRFDNNVYCLAYPQSADIIYDIADGIPQFCPLIEVPERKHGKWKDSNYNLVWNADGVYKAAYQCSNCGACYPIVGCYCPNCGARMDGES